MLRYVLEVSGYIDYLYVLLGMNVLIFSRGKLLRLLLCGMFIMLIRDNVIF